MKNIMRQIVAGAAIAILAGCASPSTNDLTPDDVAQLQEPLECQGKAACDLMWRRAQLWVAQHSGYKIQLATDVIIETHNARDYSLRWAMRVIRDPITAERDRISLIPSCGNAPLCSGSASKLDAEFRRDMRAAR